MYVLTALIRCLSLLIIPNSQLYAHILIDRTHLSSNIIITNILKEIHMNLYRKYFITHIWDFLRKKKFHGDDLNILIVCV